MTKFQRTFWVKLTDSEPKFVEMLIFDAIIGNSDRHQENWGFISKFNETIIEIEEEIKTKKRFFQKLYPILKMFLATAALAQRQLEEENNTKPRKSTLQSQSLIVKTDFSPIYDSGCCLGRELVDTKIEKMLTNTQMLDAYVNKGKAEIRIEEGKKKPQHFELLRALMVTYKNVFTSTISRINEVYSFEGLKEMIQTIDKELPSELSHYKLSENRKELMINLIDLRIQKLKQLIE